MILAGILVVCFLPLVAVWVYFEWPAWKLRKIPTAPYIPGLGHLPLLAKHQVSVYIKLAKELGPIYRFQLGRQPIVHVASADLCQEIGVRKFKSFPNRVIPPYVRESPIHLNGMSMSKAPDWMKMRNVLVPTFHTAKLSTYIPMMEKTIEQALEVLDKHVGDGEDVNMTTLVQKMALDIIGETAFGASFDLVKPLKGNMEENKDFIDAVLKSLNTLKMDDQAPLSTFLGLFFPFLQHITHKIMRRIPGTGDWDQFNGNLRLVKGMQALLSRRQEEMARGVTRNDALSLLLDARSKSEEMREVLSNERVLALAYEMMLAGSESTATSLCYALYYISAHKEEESKLLEEIDELAPGEAKVTFDEIDKFKYLDMVLKESLRHASLNPVVAREAIEDVELAGYHIPKGTWVWMALNAVAEDTSDFPEPHLFRPERFNPDCKEAEQRHPYAYAPFGVGPRTCIGNKFANLEMKLVLIRFYQRYTFDHSPVMEKPLALHLGIVLRPLYGIKLRLQKRHK